MNEQKGTIDLLYYEGYDADCGVPCRIRLCRDQIRICWEEESDIGPGSQEVVYLGEDRGHGHYELHCQNRNGKATLHGFPGARLLVGDLIENNLRQMWRVNLFSDGTGDDE